MSAPLIDRPILRSRIKYKLHPSLPEQQYHALRYASASTLKRGLDGNWRKAFAPFPRSAAMLLGSLVHCMVLEPELLEERYAVAPQLDRRTKAGKDAWSDFEQEHTGKDVVTQEQWDAASNCTEAVLRHPSSEKLLEFRKEHSIVWYDEESRLPCKARLDLWSQKSSLVVDLKTTQDASPSAFSRQCANLHYAVQAAHYMDAVQVAQNGDRPQAFAFLVVETVEPFSTGLYYIEDGSPTWEAGAAILKRAKTSLRDWLDTAPRARHSHYGDGKPQILELPAWYYREAFPPETF